MSKKFGIANILALVVLSSLVYFYPHYKDKGNPASPSAGQESVILDAFENRRSGIPVEITASVSRLLADDTQAPRHQRFIVQLAVGHSLLIAHNIDLAPRVTDLGKGDTVEIKGIYEWNHQGGVVHWTHHDPAGNQPGGWIRHKDKRYQ